MPSTADSGHGNHGRRRCGGVGVWPRAGCAASRRWPTLFARFSSQSRTGPPPPQAATQTSSSRRRRRRTGGPRRPTRRTRGPRSWTAPHALAPAASAAAASPRTTPGSARTLMGTVSRTDEVAGYRRCGRRGQ
jgi:hypothetical protein